MPDLETEDMQGLISRGYANLRAASYVLLKIDDPASARSWLARIAHEVTPAPARPVVKYVDAAAWQKMSEHDRERWAEAWLRNSCSVLSVGELLDIVGDVIKKFVEPQKVLLELIAKKRSQRLVGGAGRDSQSVRKE